MCDSLTKHVKLLNLILVALDVASACDENWFGQLCHLRCNCPSNFCGVCNRGVCTDGWFGRGCQFVNLVSEAEFVGPDRIALTDQNDTTCVETESVTVSWKLHHSLYWIKISHQYELTDPGTLVFRNSEGVVEQRYLTHIVDTFCTFDYYFQLSSLSNSVTISFKQKTHVCEIKISGGRNLALKGLTPKLPTCHSMNTEQAVDGSRDTLLSSCSQTTCSGMQHWQLTLRNKTIFRRFVIVNTNSMPEHLKNFTVKGYDTTQNLATYFYQNNEVNDNVVTYDISNIGSMVDQVTISAFKSPLTLCEVEIYGEMMCDVNSYGVECELRCNCGSGEICVPSTGDCINLNCAPGYEGIQCLESVKCSTPPNVVNSRWDDCEMSYKSSCTLLCHKGYHVEGIKTITCQANRQWTTPGNCVETKCKTPQTLENGKWRFCNGTTCHLKCRRGYKVEGNAIIKCQDNGEWSLPGKCIDAMAENGCIEGWFGPSCYYRDIMFLANEIYPQHLRENGSCYSTNFVHIKFKAETYFISVRITFFHTESNMSAATLHAFLNGNENKCPESTHFRVDSYNVEILCKSKLVVTEIKIIFNSNASICKLQVNGGRDLIKEANVAISFDNHSHSINYVHENIEENCLIIKRPGKKISLESKFDWPREVYQIVIHTQETSDTSLNNIIVEMFNDEDRLVFSRALDHFAFIHEFNFDKHDFIMKIVLSTSNVLPMCGIQAYGECTKRRYGIHCDHICSITCRHQDCQFTGVCKECMPNRVGDYCMDYENKKFHSFPVNKTESTIFNQHQQNSSMSSNEKILIIVFVSVLLIIIFINCSRRSSRGNPAQE